MSLEENKAIVRRFNDAFNKNELEVFDNLLVPDLVDRCLQLKQNSAEIHKGFPDVYRSIENIIAEGDMVWMYVKGTGTHTGIYHRIAPTGKKFTFSGTVIFRIGEGKIVKIESEVWDFMDIFKQIGAIEFTEKAKNIFSR
jgi:predicted ester cyclase